MRCSIALAGALMLGNIAAADIVLVTDTRLVRAEAAVSRNGASDSDGPNTESATFGDPFEGSALANAVVSGAAAGASASQNSAITPTSITALGSVSLSTSVLSGGAASCAGRSLVDLVVEFPEPTLVEVLSSTVGEGVFELRTAQDQVLFSGPGFFRAVLAGRYRFLADSDAAYSAPPSGTNGGGFSVSLSIVPAPGAAALGALALVPCRRRRRA